MKPTLRGGIAAVLSCFFAVALHATIGVSLQMQTGNPTGATADPNNHTHSLIQRAQYALDYNDTTRDPNWVAWNLTASDHGSVARSDFVPDPALPAGFYAVTTDDYNGVGGINFNRGHMCPSADRNDTVENNVPAFYMTNIVPQSADNNQGPWERFEDECRNLASAGNELLIMSGPSLFGGAKIPSNVADIPNYVWKIAVVIPAGPGTALSRIDANTRVIALKMPNINGIRANLWTDYVVSVSEIESDTGYQFFTSLPVDVANALRIKVDGSGSSSGAPTITTQPVSQAALPGASVTFSVGASGGSLSYQWRNDGDDILNATNPTLTLTNVQAADAAGYDVVVSNATDSVTSALATLTLSTPTAPVISQQPGNQTVTASGTATFAIVATGLPNPTYQWYKNDPAPVAGAPSAIAGATTATLILAGVQAPDSGSFYKVIVTNSVGSVTSDAATLTVNSVPPTITTQPGSQNVAVSGSATFTVAANGSAPFTYQWRKNGAAIASATSATLNLTGIQPADGGTYDVLVANAAGSAASNLAVLAVSASGTTTSPTQIQYAGGTYTQNFDGLPSTGTITLTGTGAVVTYLSNAPINAANLGGWALSKYAGTGTGTAPLFTVNNGSSNTGSVFSYGTTGASDRALGSVSSASTISRFGATFVNNTGQTITQFTLSYTGEQWRRGSAAANVLAFSYAVGGTDINTGGFANAAALNFTAPNTTGANATLDGNSSASPANRTAITSTVNVTWAPGQPLVLRWSDVDDGGSDDGVAIDDLSFSTNVAGAASTVAIASTSPAANAANASVSAPVTVTFNQPVTTTGAWFTITSAANGPVAAIATGGPTTFNLTPAAGFAYNDTLTVTLAAAQITDQATGTGHPTSNYTFAFKTAAPTAPAIATHPASQDVVVGGNVSFAVTATGTAPLTYQWRKDTTPINGATDATLSLTGVALTDSGSYDVVVNNVTNLPATSHPAVLTVSLTPIAPTITAQPQPVVASLGGTATFTVGASGSTPLSYQWRKDDTDIPNATNATLTLSGVTFLSAGNYSVVVSNAASPAATSNEAALTVNTATGASVLAFTGSLYTQNFNTLPSSGSFSFSSNGPIPLDTPVASGGVGATGLTGWSFAKYDGSGGTAVFRVDTGSSNSGGATSYGSSSSTDRALGSLGSGSVASRFGLMLVNQTGATITQFTLSYAGEQWRKGGSNIPNTLAFAYAVGGADINTGAFVAVPALDFTGPIVTTTSGALDGNAFANRTIVCGQVAGLNWAPGQVLALRWSDVDNGGADDGIAIDDLVFSLTPPVAPVIANGPLAQTVQVGANVSFFVDATGSPALVYQWRKDGTPLVNGGAISGATSATLALSNVSTASTGSYDVIVTNGISAPLTSSAAALTVNKIPATVTFGLLAATYDGTPKAATATTAPVSGLPVTFTYNSSSTAPTNAGSYTVVATITSPTYEGSATDTFVISPATPTLTWPAPAAVVYGTALGAAQLNATASVAGTFVYTPPAGTVLGAGAGQTLSVVFTPADANYSPVTATTTITVTPAIPTVSWPVPAPITYGTALSSVQLNATASVAGAFAYSPAAGTVLNAGVNQTLNALFTPADPNYATVPVSTTITVDKASPILSWAPPAPISYGTPLGSPQLNATANVAGTFTYNPPAGTVLDAGPNQPLNVAFTPTNPTNYTGASATRTITVNQTATTISLADLVQPYDGTPKSVTVVTTPADLHFTVTYDGSATPPTNPGSYAVVATINETNYTGTTTGTLVIGTTALVLHAPNFNGGIDGSVQVLSPENMTLNGNAWISGNLLVPGTPTVRLNGHPTYGSTLEGTGNASPSNYTITLNGNAVLQHVVTRTNARSLPTVTPPPTPTGTRNVTINTSGQSAGDFATLRNLTLNGNVGAVTVPPGTYGTFIANGNGRLVLGVAGSSTPALYNLQGLTFNGNAQIEVVGPVVINLASGTIFNGDAGSSGQPEWLTLNVASGDVTINGNGTFNGSIVAPASTINLNGKIHGTTASSRLAINGNGLLDQP